MEEKPLEQLYTLQDIAPVIGVTYRTLLNYIYAGKLPARKICGSWRVTESDIKAFYQTFETGETRSRKG